MTNPSAERLSAHQAHKAEAFSGMQRYHSSEISHKQDAITILQSILASVVAIYGGLLAAVVVSKVNGLAAGAGALVTLLLAGLGVWQSVEATNSKIKKDNDRYEKYRADYVSEWRLLGLESDFKEADLSSQWSAEEDRSTTGTHATREILSAFGWFIFLVALVGTILVWVAAWTQRQPQPLAL